MRFRCHEYGHSGPLISAIIQDWTGLHVLDLQRTAVQRWSLVCVWNSNVNNGGPTASQVSKSTRVFSRLSEQRYRFSSAWDSLMSLSVCQHMGGPAINTGSLSDASNIITGQTDHCWGSIWPWLTVTSPYRCCAQWTVTVIQPDNVIH